MERTAIPTEQTALTNPQSFPHLASLVGTGELEAFLTESLGKAPFRRRLPEAFGRDLFCWDRLNAGLAQQRLGPPRLKLEKDAKDAGKGVFRPRVSGQNNTIYDVDLPLLYERMRDGATLVLDAVNEFGGALQALCDGLANEFTAASQTNLYACWGTSQGFDVHWDDHDVFVIQLEGTKHWQLYGATRKAPLRKDVSHDHLRPAEPHEEIVLEAGDMLYLPRGYWHAASGLGVPSLHLTVGLTRKTGHDFLAWLSDQALADEVVRTDLPLESDDAALGKHIAAVLASAVSDMDPADLGRRFRRHAEARRNYRPQTSFPCIGQVAFAFEPATRIALARGAIHLRSASQPSAFILSHRGVEYTLASSLHPAIAAMVQGKAVTYGDLAHASPSSSEISAFLTEMISRGVFVLAAS
jgi:hypothetical protein